MVSLADLGERCVWCGEDTSFGSGKFVNRIPASVDLSSSILSESESTLPEGFYTVEGYGCEDCYTEGDNR